MTSTIARESYETAAKLLGPNRSALVFGGSVRPNWLEHGERFWYTVETEEGRRHIVVNPNRGTRREAFDHERLASALGIASGEKVDAARLPISALSLAGNELEFDAFGSRWRSSPTDDRCERVENHLARRPLELSSPDGKFSVFRRGYDLWARSLENGREWALTDDGSADYGYGFPVDSVAQTALFNKLGLPHSPPLVRWSSDSTRVVTHRTDQRQVETMPLIETSPGDCGRPRVVELRYALPGDEILPRAELIVIDVASGRPTPAKADPLLMPYFSPIATASVWWGEHDSAVYYLDRPRSLRTMRLHRIDANTGDVSLVIEEHAETRIEPAQSPFQKPIVRVLSDGNQVLWYSQWDNWGHLYLYDAHSGGLITQLTSGEWAVQEILHIDETAGIVYFVASGLIDADPYRRTVCSVGLDGAGFSRITDDELDHVVQVPENGKYFIDSASTVDSAPVITVRDWNGHSLVELERADVSRLEATGWNAPERIRVLAADETTELYGVLYKPHDFDQTKQYPVIDHPYPGPQVQRVQPSFGSSFNYDAEAIAALGFVVFAVDGRGTPGRSKAFHDESYGRLGDAGCLEDHVSALHQLARSRPWMDLDRVGMFGRSGGGYATVRAMCDFPETYKVGVAECGNHENRIYHSLWSESYDGPFDEEVAARSSNIEVAHNLQGKLLLIHGGNDDNVTPHNTFRLIERLIEGDKDFDLLFVPGAEHSFFGYEHYVSRRRWDYLVRNLMLAEPPADYRIPPMPPERYLEMLGVI